MHEMGYKPTDYSLADFFISDSPDIMRPPQDFTQWREEGEWAFRQYEPCFAGPPTRPHHSLRWRRQHVPSSILERTGIWA